MIDEQFSPLLEKIEELLKKGNVVLAIDGGSASGKTTLADKISRIFDGTVFHTDDFYLPTDRRTQDRLQEPGGTMDRERLLCEVLHPLIFKKDVLYRPYDCKSNQYKEPTVVAPKRLVIIEGAYSMHPVVASYYDFSIFLDIDKETQKKRILNRNTSDKASRFFEEWIPREDIYFKKTRVKDRCDLIFEIKEQK